MEIKTIGLTSGTSIQVSATKMNKIITSMQFKGHQHISRMRPLTLSPRSPLSPGSPAFPGRPLSA